MIENKYLIGQILQNYESAQSYSREMDYYNEKRLLADGEYSDVYYALKSADIDLQKAEYFGDEEKVEILRTEKARLERKKSELEQNFGYFKKDKVYACDKCKDSGKTADGFCHCFYEKLTDLAYTELEVRKHRLNDFSDDTLTETEQRMRTEKLYSYARNFSTDSKNLLFIGSPGTGKTFLSSAIANEVAKKNYNVIYLTACELNQILVNYHTAPLYKKQTVFDVLSSCDLLVIDDLGTEPIFKNVTVEYLLSIISERDANRKPYVISTNLSLEKLLQRYGERIFSRLKSKNTVKLLFGGKDLR